MNPKPLDSSNTLKMTQANTALWAMTPSTISSLTSIKPLVLWLCTTLGLLWVSTDRGSLLL